MPSVIKRTYKNGKETKKCPKCKEEKFLISFPPRKCTARKLGTYCKDCEAILREENQPIWIQRYKNRRTKFLDLYGNKCACCGETIEEFLTIEHKLGQVGKKKESSHTAYIQAAKEYRPDLYEILCMNCNHAKGKYGYCPHKQGTL